MIATDIIDLDSLSPWQQLRCGSISLEQALNLLISKEGEVKLESLDRDVIDRFNSRVPVNKEVFHVIPLLIWQGRYYLGCSIELDAVALDSLSRYLNARIECRQIQEKSYIDYYYKFCKKYDGIDASQRINPITGELLCEDISETTKFLLSQVENDNNIRKLQAFWADALRNRASDIHFEPSADGLKIRYRIDGILIKAAVLEASYNQTLISAIKVMSDMDPANRRTPQDGRMTHSYTLGEIGSELDIRVNTLPCEEGESAVLRLLPKKASFSRIEEIGFSDVACATYKEWLQQPQGLIVFTGPTGSGKTSTLYTSLLERVDESVKVITVENPVEYHLPGIIQTNVNHKAGMTFAKGLEAILRQDPDIIMIGEIRNCETAETALQAAMTGHLVLTTLHTNDAVGAIRRLRDLGVDPGSVSDALLGVVSQRLVRRVCPHCSEPYTPTTNELHSLGLERESVDLSRWRKGKGCKRFYNTGYLGREAVVELLDVDSKIQELIYGGTTHQLQTYLYEIDYESFRKGAISKLVTGVTTLEEIFRVLHRNALNHPHSN